MREKAHKKKITHLYAYPWRTAHSQTQEKWISVQKEGDDMYLKRKASWVMSKKWE